MSKPLKIKLVDNKLLYIKFDDGNEFNLPLKYLRDESPDAGNKGETILWRHYPGEDKVPDNTPGKYEIKRIDKVGNYAINITWGDGENNGIYSWEYLVKLGETLEIEKSLPDRDNK